MEMQNLKRCPFCGGKAEYSKIDTSETVPFGTVQHFVTCKNNCLEGLYARGNTKEEAIKAWNRRRPSPWHTEMPTEEGLYVVLTKVTTIGIHSSEGTYILDWWDGYCFKNLKQMARHNPVFGNDVYSWVKWRRIEP